MSLQSLDNLVKIGQLKTEARNHLEFIESFLFLYRIC